MQARADFRQSAADWVVRRINWLNEMDSQLNLTRLYGRALPNTRVVESVPANYGSNYTRLAALSLAGVQAPWLLAGALDSESFCVYVAAVRAPVLEPGNIVVCDNLATYKIAGLAELVAARGARWEYLPPY